MFRVTLVYFNTVNRFLFVAFYFRDSYTNHWFAAFYFRDKPVHVHSPDLPEKKVENTCGVLYSGNNFHNFPPKNRVNKTLMNKRLFTVYALITSRLHFKE